MASKGILTGADVHMEKYLPWWFGHLRKYTDLPVAFADFGMSSKAKEWCLERGQVFEVPEQPTAQKEDVAHRETWEKAYTSAVWTRRKAWFQKPLACLKTPFSSTLWLDLDCEVCKPLNFSDSACALVPEGSGYNSGVIVFQQGALFLQAWVNESLQNHSLHMGDQDALSRIVQDVEHLPAIYNWRMRDGFNPDAVIVHWVGVWGKEYLDRFGDFHRLRGC